MNISKLQKTSQIFYVILFVSLVLFLPNIARATSIGTNVTVTGNTTLGDTAASDTITVTARLAADLDPNANNTIDLGAFDLAYNDIFASGTTYVATLTIDGNAPVGNATSDTITVTARLAADLDPNANNTIDLGSFDLAYNNIFVSSTSYLGSVTSTMINPWANNTSDLGAYGNAWKNFYASSTVYLTSVSTTQGIEAAPDTDTNFKFGRAAIFVPTPLTDALAIAHVDNASVLNFALYQDAAGLTAINSKVGQPISFDIGAVAEFAIDSTIFHADNANGPALVNEAASATNPTLRPDRSGDTTGIGGSSGVLSFITDGVERINIDSGGSVTITGGVLPGAHNTYDFGTQTASWQNIYASSTAFLRFVSSTMIEPYVNDSSDLGSFGRAWNNLYASSTLYLGASGATSTIISNVNGSGSSGQGSCMELTASDGTVMYCSVTSSLSTSFSCSSTSCKWESAD